MDRILIAEDDESIQRELAALLAAHGYLPVFEPPCELALLDVNLPGENGFSLCRRLKSEYNVPVIFLTARESAEDELTGFGAGGDDYVRKPYNAEVLLGRSPYRASFIELGHSSPYSDLHRSFQELMVRELNYHPQELS